MLITFEGDGALGTKESNRKNIESGKRVSFISYIFQ
jgi:hypothetical protein